MSAWLAIRWCIALLLGMLSLLTLMGQISCVILVVRRSISTSVIPFLGGMSGAIALVACPVEGVWRWFWFPLLLDTAIFGLLITILSRRNAKRQKMQAK